MFLLSYITCTTVNMWSTLKYYLSRPIMHTYKRGMPTRQHSSIYCILLRYTSLYIILPQCIDTSSWSIVLPHGILGSPLRNI